MPRTRRSVSAYWCPCSADSRDRTMPTSHPWRWLYRRLGLGWLRLRFAPPGWCRCQRGRCLWQSRVARCRAVWRAPGSTNQRCIATRRTPFGFVLLEQTEAGGGVGRHGTGGSDILKLRTRDLCVAIERSVAVGEALVEFVLLARLERCDRGCVVADDHGAAHCSLDDIAGRLQRDHRRTWPRGPSQPCRSERDRRLHHTSDSLRSTDNLKRSALTTSKQQNATCDMSHLGRPDARIRRNRNEFVVRHCGDGIRQAYSPIVYSVDTWHNSDGHLLMLFLKTSWPPTEICAYVPPVPLVCFY